MASGDEYYFSGGLYDPKQDDRTDVYLKEVGPGKGPAAAHPTTLQLILVGGNFNLALIDLLPEDVARLGKWMQEVAGVMIRRTS